jgi:uncharacterized protein involved in exopolysaccharide biosynthesis
MSAPFRSEPADLPGPRLPATGAQDGSAGSVTLTHWLTLLLRHRWLLLLLPAAVALAAAAVALATPRRYASTAAFVPEQKGPDGSSLAGMAAQFGIALPGSGPAESPAFYAELLRSRDLLQNLLAQRYRVPTDEGVRQATLPALLRVRATDPARREELALRRLRGLMDVTPGRETGVVRVVVTSEYPELSQQIAAHAIEQVESYNLNRRQTRAAAERAFTQERLEEESAALLQAERAVERFLSRNRQYENSPTLTFQLERLQREVTQRQQVHAALVDAYEQARIEAVRQTPMISVLERPVAAGLPVPRGTVTRFLLGGLIGLLLALLIIFLGESLRQERSESGDHIELQRLRRQFLDELLLPINRLRRSRQPGPPTP